jgi:hypothetical protein
MTIFVRILLKTLLRNLSLARLVGTLSQEIRDLREGGKNSSVPKIKKQRISPLLLSGLYPPPGTLPNPNY